MIAVDANAKLIFVRGVHRHDELLEAVMEATGQKRPRLSGWVVVGLSDEASIAVHSALPFSPPDDRIPIGFKRHE